MSDLAPITHPLLTAAGIAHGFFTRAGGVSTGIAVEELHNIGVTHAIRIGSCGALQTGIAIDHTKAAALLGQQLDQWHRRRW